MGFGMSKTTKKRDVESKKRVKSQIAELKHHLASEEEKLKGQRSTVETSTAASTVDIEKIQENIEEIRQDIKNLKKTNELMIIKLIEFLGETGKITKQEDFSILVKKVSEISKQLNSTG